MNRRGFIAALGAVAAGFAIDPERALWVPGRKLVSIPRLRAINIDCSIRYDRTRDQITEVWTGYDPVRHINHWFQVDHFQAYMPMPSPSLPDDVRAFFATRLGVDRSRLVLA